MINLDYLLSLDGMAECLFGDSLPGPASSLAIHAKKEEAGGLGNCCDKFQRDTSKPPYPNTQPPVTETKSWIRGCDKSLILCRH